jgi:hypothetical protein
MGSLITSIAICVFFAGISLLFFLNRKRDDASSEANAESHGRDFRSEGGEDASSEANVKQHDRERRDMPHDRDGGDKQANDADSAVSSAEIMEDALIEIGCQPRYDKNGNIHVSYQGENFTIYFTGRYASIWDLAWGTINVNDPKLPLIREAMNITNYGFGNTMVLSNPGDDGEMVVHTHREIMLHPACPDNTKYIRATLDSFFDTKTHFAADFKNLEAMIKEDNEERRPVGFDHLN